MHDCSVYQAVKIVGLCVVMCLFVLVGIYVCVCVCVLMCGFVVMYVCVCVW